MTTCDTSLSCLMPTCHRNTKGMVYLVGAGPGDPELLTCKALKLLQRADVILYDQLVSKEVLDLARHDAEFIFVGKKKNHHSQTQASINHLLADRATLGQQVIRLKGGDPLLFGRCGEEIAYLRTCGIDVEIVPGITAASACAAAVGISLTDRFLGSAVTFITGYSHDGIAEYDWATLVRKNHTLVVYMGLSVGMRVADRLIYYGLSSETPIVLIENGTLSTQKIITSTLIKLAQGEIIAPLTGPTIIIIGQVVTLADSQVEHDSKYSSHDDKGNESRSANIHKDK